MNKMISHATARTMNPVNRSKSRKPGIAFLCAFLLLSGSLLAQESLRPRFGLAGHVGVNDHVADFPRIPGTQSCCLGFDGGSGTGFDGGGLIEFPLSNRLLLGARLTFMTQPFSMTTPEGTYVIVNGVGQDGTFEHHLDGSLSSIGIEPTVGVRLFGSLFLHAGAWTGYPIVSSYEQEEQLTQPSGSGTFLNADGSDSRKRTRNEFSGDLPEPGFQIAPLAGLSYELPMNANRTLLLVPEVSYQFGLTDVIADVSWKINALRAGVALKFSPRKAKESRRLQNRQIDTVRLQVPVVARAYSRGVENRSETTEETDGVVITTETVRRTDTLFAARPTVAAEPKLAATVTAAGVQSDGAEVPAVRLRVEEFSSTLMTPLLNYVFFDENSGTIPDRYRDVSEGEVESFDIDRINSPDRLPTYHHLLNIVGRRLRDNPKAKLTLTGCNQDIRDEKGNVELSRRRAEAVREYLTNVWKIDAARIGIEARDLPEKAANTMTADGSEENRRVEITSDDPRILAPIVTSDTLRRVDPPTVRFRTTAVADAGVRSWDLSTDQSGTTLKALNGGDSVPTFVDWNINRESGTIPRSDAAITYTLAVTDSRGAAVRSQSTIPVEQVTIRKKRTERRGDMEVDRFSLILFDVRSSELQSTHAPIIGLIKKEIEPNSTVSVTGYTDRLGEEAYNQELADRRAATVANALGKERVGSTGLGEADIFDSELPEGRLYTRTVEVIIETPVRE